MVISHRKWKLSPTRLAILAVVASLALAVVGFFWYRTEKRIRPAGVKGAAEAQADTGYVDAQVCATCHGQIARTFQKTGMARSFYRPTAGNLIEDYAKANTFAHKPSGLHYRMIERDGRFFERRFTLGMDGKEENVREETIDYVLGSGNHARTYMHRTTQGKLIELPVSWYVEKQGYWNMSPGFDRVDQQDMQGAIGEDCMFCHNAYPEHQKVTQPNHDFSVFPAKLPEGIDCQRCHGPGAAHVAAATGGEASLQQIRSKIVNPAKLSRDRQMEVCMECHMETSALHVPNAIRNYDRAPYSFHPGEKLGEFKTYFERPKDPKGDEFEVAHAGYQLQRSACYRNSQMTCLTCHNPHDIPRGEEAKRQYIAVCEKCHQKVSHQNVVMTKGSDCLSCHMPKRRTEGSVHIVLTDHYVQRVRPSRDLRAAFAEKVQTEDGTPVRIYYPTSVPTEREELLLAVARVNDEGIDGIGQLKSQIDHVHPSWPEPYVALAKAYARKGKIQDAIATLNEALKLREDDRAAMRELASVMLNAGQVNSAVDLLQRAVSRYPEDDGFLANLANAYLQQGKLTEAQETASRTMAINPDRPDVHDLEGLIAAERHDTSGAEQAFREAIRMRPNLSEPHNNLANLLIGERRFPEAEMHFRRAIALRPGYGDAHHGLGLLMIMERKNAEATQELLEAVRVAPGDASAHADLADLLTAEGRLTDAAAEYRRALALNPAKGDANLGLAMILLQQGGRAEGLRYLQAAAQSSDPETSQHAQALLGQMFR
jgi:predicted CXXCH cytochrome family protein